jgi:hypothetical protein
MTDDEYDLRVGNITQEEYDRRPITANTQKQKS